MLDPTDALLRLADARDRLTVEPATLTRLAAQVAVLEAAVVARPDETWGETPCAFITLKPGAEATEVEMMAFCRERMARFKVPRTVVFGPLPKTSTGKMQKYMLREQARTLGGVG